jgi:transposase
MNQPTNTDPTPSGQIQFAAFVGIDWADREHAWALQVPGSDHREHGKLAQTPEAIEDWAMSLTARFAGRPIAIALEQARGALLYALSKYEPLVLFPIHPSTSSKYRAAMFPSAAKDDPKDAELLLELLLWHRDRLRPLLPDTSQIRQLQVLVERRRQLVNQKTAFRNRITDQLKQYFPQVLRWFEDVDSPLVAAFLQRWPTLPDLQGAAPAQIRKFLHAHNSRCQSRNQQRLEEIAKARPLTVDAAIVEPAVLMVETLLQLVQALWAGIAKVERAIAKLCAEQPDYAIFDSFPGAGEALAPRLLAAFGSRRDRYLSAGQVQTASGIAPVISRSGKSMSIHFRWACPKFLRQTFHEYAESSIQFSAWARAFYDQQRAREKSHQAAVRSLAFKWIRILYRCWVDRIPYSEQRHRPGLAAPANPAALSEPAKPAAPPAPEKPALPPHFEGSDQYVWKKVAGFWKFSAVTS